MSLFKRFASSVGARELGAESNRVGGLTHRVYTFHEKTKNERRKMQKKASFIL